ncbi:MAG: GNAT family N-acetyltransferase [Bacteroidaceae bacterium]|nr:GNAT family N-acetyltransferase [Bacteroidaceae bacterium]
MGHIVIRHATLEDLPAILSLIEQGRQIMRSDGNLHQWSGTSPSEDLLVKDIQHQHSYLCLQDGKVIGTFAFIPGPDPTYLKIYEGAWIDVERPYYVIHRMASTPDSHGVFAAAMDYCFQLTDNIRIDTHRDNRIMQHNLLKHGFQYCGIIYLLDGDERLAYQLIMDN